MQRRSSSREWRLLHSPPRSVPCPPILSAPRTRQRRGSSSYRCPGPQPPSAQALCGATFVLRCISMPARQAPDALVLGWAPQACTCPNGGDFETNFCCALSQEACGKHCDSIGMTLAGVEAGHVCFCGHTLVNASATLPMSACDAKPCPGTRTGEEACGGNNVMLSFAAASMRNATVPHPVSSAPLHHPGNGL